MYILEQKIHLKKQSQNLKDLHTFTPHQDTIQIPRPSYGYGSTFRSRFAFGRVTKEQARIHTANQNRNTEIETQTERDEPPPAEEAEPTTEMTEEQEEDPFQNDEQPNKDDCA